MWTVSDETLVAGLAAGDREAASAFVQRFQRRVYGLARTIVYDDRDRLRVALAGLPEEQSRAVVLAGLLGYTAREVGEIEDIPLGTAKTRIRTALLRLRAALVSEEQP